MVAFVNSFLSYLLLVVIIVALIGVACFIGITLRKRKNATLEAAEESATQNEA